MSAPNYVNVNVSHSICDFGALDAGQVSRVGPRRSRVQQRAQVSHSRDVPGRVPSVRSSSSAAKGASHPSLRPARCRVTLSF